jgi:hypothetical protein
MRLGADRASGRPATHEYRLRQGHNERDVGPIEPAVQGLSDKARRRKPGGWGCARRLTLPLPPSPASRR